MTNQRGKEGQELLTKLRQTQELQDVLKNAIETAKTLGHAFVNTDDLLVALTNAKERYSTEILQNLGVKPEQIVRLTDDHRIIKIGSKLTAPPQLALRSEFAMRWAEEEARSIGDLVVGPEHLLLGLLKEQGRAAFVLEKTGVTLIRARHQLRVVTNTRMGVISGSL